MAFAINKYGGLPPIFPNEPLIELSHVKIVPPIPPNSFCWNFESTSQLPDHQAATFEICPKLRL